MKIKTTRKAIVNATAPAHLRRAGYCELQYLLKSHEPIAYTAGVYGWNFDAYSVNGLMICTGYRNMPGAKLEGCREYDDKARKIWEDYNTPYDERAAQVEELLAEFCRINGGY